MPQSIDEIIEDNEGCITEDDAFDIRQEEMRSERNLEEDFGPNSRKGDDDD